ncbi:hypothetical protein D7Z96_02860 [Pseudarthrobacter phenanthrenivorans]|uniref:Uncharacterized protein n=1 Tax=Pseudarthrobacter phenanthrenivorans TaxID=361575 RepID=A0A3B0FJA5_PSEPS|nr:hypothetical protein D7Z96_02860 [Pseudarthrobacter phenanthrenivorans]
MSRPPVNPAGSASSPDNPAGGPDPHSDFAGRTRPAGVIIVALVVLAEATALLTAAGWYGYQLVSGSPVLSFWGALFTLVLLLAFAAWLYAVALFLFRGYRWTRAAALVAQLFVLTIGFPTLTGGLLLAGLAMLLPAVTAIVLLFQNKVISYASRTGGSTPAL